MRKRGLDIGLGRIDKLLRGALVGEGVDKCRSSRDGPEGTAREARLPTVMRVSSPPCMIEL